MCMVFSRASNPHNEIKWSVICNRFSSSFQFFALDNPPKATSQVCTLVLFSKSKLPRFAISATPLIKRQVLRQRIIIVTFILVDKQTEVQIQTPTTRMYSIANNRNRYHHTSTVHLTRMWIVENLWFTYNEVLECTRTSVALASEYFVILFFSKIWWCIS